MDGRTGLFVCVKHLCVLRTRDGEVKVQSDALRALRNSIDALPREVVNGAD
jgi:hypothetical protein